VITSFGDGQRTLESSKLCRSAIQLAAERFSCCERKKRLHRHHPNTMGWQANAQRSEIDLLNVNHGSARDLT
jgi:hypothetical protein